MKNSNDLKAYRSPVKQHNKENNPEISQMSIGSASKAYENTTGSNDDIAMDVQETIGRDVCLSLVADNIRVSVEGENVSLEGEVFIHNEKSKSTTRRVPW